MVNPGEVITSNVAADLVTLRQDFQTVALKDIWENGSTDFPISREMREDFISFIENVMKLSNNVSYLKNLTSLPGTRNSVGLNHEALDIATNTKIDIVDSLESDLFAMYSEEQFIGFAVSAGERDFQLIKPMALGRLLNSLIGKYSLLDNDLSERFSQDSAVQSVRNYLLNLTNIPQHSLSKTGYLGDVKVINDVESIRIEVLGKFGARK